MTDEQAIEELEFALDIACQIARDIERKIFIRKSERKDWRERHQNAIEALTMGINSLKEPSPCENCVGVGLAVAHGYTDMRIKKPETVGLEGTKING